MLMYKDVTDLILRAFYQVYRDLGYGFLEHIYEIAMLMKTRELGLEVRNQLPIDVHFQGVKIGRYFADLAVNHVVIVEIKAAKGLCEENEAQLLNYLRATDYEVGFLLNFGYRPEFRRFVFENSRKGKGMNGTRTTRMTQKAADKKI
jgi:GxxExxY protein